MKHKIYFFAAVCGAAMLLAGCNKSNVPDSKKGDEKTEKTIADKLDECKGKPFNIKERFVGNIDAIQDGGENYFTMQGMGSDGEYLYFVLLAQKKSEQTEEERLGKIVKYSTNPFKCISYSKEKASLGHGNDLAYDFTGKNMIVAPMTKNDAIIRYDTENMKIIKEDFIPNFGAKVWAIASQLNGNFLIFKGATLCHTENNFTKLRTFNRTDSTEGYSGQGLGMDDKYAYVPMSSKPRGHNILVVYNFIEKKYITTLKINDDSEIESFVFHKGKYYANFITYDASGKIAGAKVCEIIPE